MDEDFVHCVVAGIGERVSLVSPFQRIGVKAGESTDFENPETRQKEKVTIPQKFTFMDINNARPDPRDIQFIKNIHVDLSKGDCIYIPPKWWF